jgi:DNA-binding XRE family transcriptional regulator
MGSDPTVLTASIIYIYDYIGLNVKYISYGVIRMDFSTLGKTIAALRRQQKVSQQIMAEHLGLSRATINALENGRSGDVGVRKIMKILDYLRHELAVREKYAFPTLEELRDEQ